MKMLSRLPSRESAYERGIYIFLSSFRFFSFALATALIFTIPEEPPLDFRTLLIVSLAGVYTVLKILFRFRIWQQDFQTYTILGIDLAACLAFVLLTHGADSPFLLYSLLPTITTALFFRPRITIIIASLTSLNLILAHTVLARLNPDFVPIVQGNYLSLVLLYVFFCFIIANITYQTNLNIYRHVQSEAIVDERRRLRREIHDGIAQVLGYISTKTSLLKKSLPPSDGKLLAELEEIHKVTSDSYQDIREAIDHLDVEAMPSSLTDALSSQTEQLGKRMGIEVKFTAPQKMTALHPAAQLQLLRIAQEALNNVRRHASASQAWVSLKTTPENVELLVKDNGQGFSPSEQKGSGLRIMEERASSINGVLTIASSPGKGTEIRVKVPRR